MALQYRLGADDYGKLADDAKKLYAQDGDGYLLSVEGLPEQKDDPAEARARLSEFRATNTSLLKERDELKQRLAELDGQAKKAEGAQKESQTLREQMAEIRKELAAQREAREASERQAAQARVESALKEEAGKAGILPTAIPDVIARAREAGAVANGQGVRFMDGESPRYDPLKPEAEMTAASWFESLKDSAPHLYKPTTGDGGGQHVGSNGAGGGKVKVSFAEAMKPEWQAAHANELDRFDVQPQG